MIKINGSYLEGGGQIVRTALALSTLTGKPFKITNIRKSRSKPGLKHQHLTAIKVLKELCNASTKGDSLESSYLEYIPRKLKFHNLNIDIGTAGSITLLLQALLPVLIFSDKKITVKITGGTDTKYSQPIDYFTNVFLPHLNKYGDFETSLEKRGYYPKGNGRFILKIKPKYSIYSFKNFSELLKFIKGDVAPINLTKQGKLLVVKGISHASKELMKANVADRQARTAKYLLSKLNVPVRINVHYVDSLSVGSGITLWAIFSTTNEMNFNNPIILGADSLGKKGKKSEIIAKEVSERLIKQIKSKAAVDKYLADQLLLYMALFSGSIKTSEITDHCKTNIYTIKKFLNVKFKTKENIITC